MLILFLNYVELKFIRDYTRKKKVKPCIILHCKHLCFFIFLVCWNDMKIFWNIVFKNGITLIFLTAACTWVCTCFYPSRKRCFQILLGRSNRQSCFLNWQNKADKWPFFLIKLTRRGRKMQVFILPLGHNVTCHVLLAIEDTAPT